MGEIDQVALNIDKSSNDMADRGPGGSSMLGLFSEIGPCLTNEHGNDTVFNEHSWTNFANVLFIE